MPKTWALFLSLAYAAAGNAADSMVRRHCTDVDFRSESWPHLQAIEPRIQLHFDRTAEAFRLMTGETLTLEKLDNCTVEFPVGEDGKAVEGYRTVILSKVWYMDQGSKRYESGLKIIYFLRYHNIGSAYEQRDRELLGFSLCKDQVSCSVLNIPFRASGGSGPSDPSPPRGLPRRAGGGSDHSV